MHGSFWDPRQLEVVQGRALQYAAHQGAFKCGVMGKSSAGKLNHVQSKFERNLRGPSLAAAMQRCHRCQWLAADCGSAIPDQSYSISIEISCKQPGGPTEGSWERWPKEESTEREVKERSCGAPPSFRCTGQAVIIEQWIDAVKGFWDVFGSMNQTTLFQSRLRI